MRKWRQIENRGRLLDHPTRMWEILTENRLCAPCLFLGAKSQNAVHTSRDSSLHSSPFANLIFQYPLFPHIGPSWWATSGQFANPKCSFLFLPFYIEFEANFPKWKHQKLEMIKCSSGIWEVPSDSFAISGWCALLKCLLALALPISHFFSFCRSLLNNIISYI